MFDDDRARMTELRMQTTVSVCVDLELPQQAAFDAAVEELSGALERHGLRLEPGPGGRVYEGEREIGQIIEWEPARMVRLGWHQPDRDPQEMPEVELRFEASDDGTRVTIAHRGWEKLVRDQRELAGWFAGEVAAPFLLASGPLRFGDWLTDRRARRPSGPGARGVYRDPLYHYPNFRVILAELALLPDDHLIEVGCGGGVLLKEALKSGCRAAGIDHSPEMVRLALEMNAMAVADGRLTIRHASADRLPFPDGSFTCGAMTGVLGFLPDAVAALRELHRVLRAGGRIVVFGSDPSLRGTPAAPEPIASRLRFYDDDQLRRLAIDAGFAEARVVRRDLLPFAREVGVPEEHLALFAGKGAPFLIARKG